MRTKNSTHIPQSLEIEIDLMEYARKLWAARKLLLKVAGIAAGIGIVIAFTTPKTYTVNVTLAPEMNKNRSSSLSSIASMLGVSSMNMGDADAINVMLYPDVLASTPFIIDLLDTQVKTMDEEVPDTTLIEYLKTNKSSLMATVISLPFRAVGGILSLFKSDDEEEIEKIGINPFHLTKEEAGFVAGLRKQISANVDKKTGVTSISVTMQDPMVAAIVTDTLLTKLKEHIINYRVAKAQEDCVYYEKLYQESKDNYSKAQQAYAQYLDANKNIALESVRAKQQMLQNEMNLTYQLYNQMATQLQMSKAKVQEAKPMFAVVEPATVPLKPSGTSRKMLLIGIVFLALAGASIWILFGKDTWSKVKDELKSKDETSNTDHKESL